MILVVRLLKLLIHHFTTKDTCTANQITIVNSIYTTCVFLALPILRIDSSFNIIEWSNRLIFMSRNTRAHSFYKLVCFISVEDPLMFQECSYNHKYTIKPERNDYILMHDNFCQYSVLYSTTYIAQIK